DLDDQAIGVVVEVPDPIGPLVGDLDHVLDRGVTPVGWIDREAPARQHLQFGVMRADWKGSLDHYHLIPEESQSTTTRIGGVESAQCSCGGVARMLQRILPGAFTFGVDALECLARDI